MPAAESQIRINTLLLEREALFTRVHALEAAAAAIFGEPYPFSRPALPSDQRSKKKRPAKTKDAESKIKLRKLEEGETAYRLIYRQGNKLLTEQHDSPEVFTTLLAVQGPQLQVLSVETLDGHGTPQALLFGTAPDSVREHDQ